MNLGLNKADQFTTMLAESSANEVIIREKFQDKTIVLFDDAAYSGKQIKSLLFGSKTSNS